MEPEHHKEQPQVSSSMVINYGLDIPAPYFPQDGPRILDAAYKAMEPTREPPKDSWKVVFILCAISLVWFLITAVVIQRACQ